MATVQDPSAQSGGAPAWRLKMGMIAIGVSGAEMLPAMEAMPEIDLMAGADINPVPYLDAK